MLTLFSKHSLMDLELTAKGDIEVDYHHTVEDTGILLGQAIAKALGDKAGIRRYGFFYVPMDEALVRSVVDLSGRPLLAYNAPAEVPALGWTRNSTRKAQKTNMDIMCSTMEPAGARADLISST